MQIFLEVSKRLEQLHDKGFVHRDLKPDNIILLPRTKNWMLIDFGISARIGELATVGFTVAYAAPETAQAHVTGMTAVTVSAAVDAWALGVIAFELLVGRPAFSLAGDLQAVRSRHCTRMQLTCKR